MVEKNNFGKGLFYGSLISFVFWATLLDVIKKLI
ncbi:hypothetical protein ABH960_000623 [Bacillus sp. RC252]